MFATPRDQIKLIPWKEHSFHRDPRHWRGSVLKRLILGRYVLLGVINTIHKHCHAWVILWNAAEGSFFGPWTLYLSFGTCHEVNIMQLCYFSIHK